MSLKTAIEVMKAGGSCNACFDVDPVLSRAACDVPQPRWIGPKYFRSKPRVCVVLINPGGGGTSANAPALRAEADLFRKFHRSGDYTPVRAYFERCIAAGDVWLLRYKELFGLDHEEIAQLNMAWCATASNVYPTTMRQRCYELQTSKLVTALEPDVVLLSGSATWPFESALRRLLPDANVIPTIHYANRKSATTKAAEGGRVRALIDAARRSG